MSARVLAVFAIAALVPLAGCDLSQKKPETHASGAGAAGSPMAVHDQRVPTTAQPDLQAPGDVNGAPAGPEATGERSIRLYGRGVSREQQIRL